jgi:hypothetical protein
MCIPGVAGRQLITVILGTLVSLRGDEGKHHGVAVSAGSPGTFVLQVPPATCTDWFGYARQAASSRTQGP